jgi:hypothetical protein
MKSETSLIALTAVLLAWSVQVNAAVQLHLPSC